MRDGSSLNFIPGVGNYDQGKYITTELYLTFKLLAGEDSVFQFEFSFTLIQSFLVIHNINNMWFYLLMIELSGLVFPQSIFHNIICYVGSTSEILRIQFQPKAVDF